MQSNLRALLIDDDQPFCEMLAEYMIPHNVAVDAVHLGEAGLSALKSDSYDLVLLDVMLPRIDGFTVLQGIRSWSGIPVIMLTAKGDEQDRVKGFDLGADDYVPKPFHARELLGRMRAVARRAVPDNDENWDEVRIGDLNFFPRRNLVHSSEGAEIRLTSVETALLTQLARKVNDTLPRDYLYRSILNREPSPFDRSLDTHICNLRRKLGPRSDGSTRILTIRGVGYKLYA